MPWPVTVGRGIASLLSRKGTKAAEKALSPTTQLRNVQSAKIMAQMSKKNYSNAFNKARTRINEMKMSAADKDAAVDRLRTFYRNQHSKEMMRTANLGDFTRQAPVTPVPELVKQGLAFALGGGAGYGVAKNEEAIIDMLKSTKLPTGIDIETTSIGDLLGRRAGAAGAGALGALLGPTGSKSLLGPMAAEGLTEATQEMRNFDPPWHLPLDSFEQEFDEPDPEPGLEEGSVGDLLLWNRIFGD